MPALVVDLGLVGSGQNKASGTTVAVVATQNIPVGATVMIGLAHDNHASTTATTHALSNTPGGQAFTAVNAALQTGQTTTAGTGIVGRWWRVKLTSAISSGQTITTITFGNAIVAKAVAALGMFGLSATIVTGASVTGVGSTAGAPSTTTAGTAPATGDVVIGFAAFEAAAAVGDSDTTNGSWSTPAQVATSGSTAQTNVLALFQWKQITAGGTQTFNPTASPAAGDAVAATLSFLADPGGQPAYDGDGTYAAAGVPGGPVLGAPSYSGDGTLVFTGTPVVPVPVGYSGAGTLTVAGAPTTPSAPAYSGSGTLAVTGAPRQASAAVYGGSGTLTAGGTPAATAGPAYTGAGTLATTATPRASAAPAYSGSGTLAAGGAPSSPGAPAYSGAGTLSSAGAPRVPATTGYSGTGTLAMTPAGAAAGAPAYSGAGTLAVAAVPALARAAAYTGLGTLAALGVPTFTRGAGYAGTGTLSIAGIPRPAGAPSYAGAGQLTVDTTPAAAAGADYTGDGTLLVFGATAGGHGASLPSTTGQATLVSHNFGGHGASAQAIISTNTGALGPATMRRGATLAPAGG